MARFIKLTFAALAVVLGATGAVSAGASAPVRDAGATDFVAVMRDENELLVLEADDGDNDDDTRDISRSRDRSRDATSADRSRSLDRSRDRTGDGVGVLDRSNSLDRSRDRSGDHNTPDVSRSNDVSVADDTSATASNTPTNTSAGGTDDSVA
jgi:hypothetical protein